MNEKEEKYLYQLSFNINEILLDRDRENEKRKIFKDIISYDFNKLKIILNNKYYNEYMMILDIRNIKIYEMIYNEISDFELFSLNHINFDDIRNEYISDILYNYFENIYKYHFE